MADLISKDKPGMLVGPGKRLAQVPVNQEEENRKILESLQMRKNILQQTVVRPPPSVASTRSASQPGQASLNQAHVMLAEAHATSPGYYVFQDSKFGNNVLPCIPRFKQQ